ncbi:PLP-dependent aminotransferase family protein [Phaeobacter sp.]|uniref:aminotransferase-like domain-containing protein n=1 Tax=Phaeobacter sp. TaxID=1902409 RepID=UPI0025E151CC|nr:PLP-dependent aminotransferase family protein [Phaeobacter sp.]
MGTIWSNEFKPDLSSKVGPKYRRVADTIRQAIEEGALCIGTKLPPVRELAYQLNITPGTVARAYTILTDAGLLQAEVGRGTFVAEPQTNVPDDVWSRQLHLLEARDPGHVSLFSPRLADVGQVSALRDAMRRVTEADPLQFLSYPTRDAYEPVRDVVANWLSDDLLGKVHPDDVVLTHGGQNGILTVFQTVLKDVPPTILVEDLSYAGFRRAAELTRAKVVGVAMDDQGILPDSFELAIRKTGAAVLCTSPEVHNPTGLFTPLERRQALVEIARRHDVQIIEDDCYRMGRPRAPGYRLLAPELAWHVTSFSKTLTPALRVGFALAPKGRGADLRRTAEYSYFGIAQPLAELTRILLADPRTPALVDKVRNEMAKYVRVAVNALGSFELVWNDSVPFLWLKLPSGWRAAAFTRAAEAQGVQIRSADEFALRDGRAPNAVRIAINGHVSIERFEDAMLRLRALLDTPPEQISV